MVGVVQTGRGPRLSRAVGVARVLRRLRPRSQMGVAQALPVLSGTPELLQEVPEVRAHGCRVASPGPWPSRQR